MTDNSASTTTGPEANRAIEDHNERLPTKRRRTAVACTICRIRKSRCNGARPSCSLCEALGFECSYEPSGSTANTLVKKDYIDGLEERLRAIEASIAKHDQLFSHAQRWSRGDSTPTHGEQWLLADNDRQSPLGELDPGSGISLRGADLQDLPPEDKVTDGMAASFSEEEDSGFFGPSSNISLMRSISRIMPLDGATGVPRTPGSNDEYYFLDAGIINTSRPQSSLGRLTTYPPTRPDSDFLYSLPSESASRQLIDRYFSNTGLLFPYIHRESFIATYEEMKQGKFKKVRRTWLGVFNMILAMASTTAIHEHDVKNAKERIQESDVFYQRAFGLCQTQMLRGTSLETVQYLLLMTQYLQGTQKSVQTWTIHGLAVKSALSIGLHSLNASRNFPPIEQEMRKRTWFGCVILDRSLSMTFGRPLAIPEDYIKVPLPSVMMDSTTSSNNVERSTATRDQVSVMFFNATISLYRITSSAIMELYGANLDCSSPVEEKEIVSRIFKLEQDLDEWHYSLPPELKLVSSALVLSYLDPDPVIPRLRIVLSLRYLNLQVFLHRPALVRYIGQRSGTDTGSCAQNSTGQLQATHIQTCLACAKDIITIVHKVVSHGIEAKKYLGAWWFSLYYVFNAALVVLGTYLAAKRHATLALACAPNAEQCIQSLDIVNATLLKLDDGNATVQRCVDYLSQLAKPIRLSTKASSVASELEQRAESNTVDPRGQSSAGQDNSHATIPNPVDDWDPTLLDSFHGGELELGQFFVPTDNSLWMHQGSARSD